MKVLVAILFVLCTTALCLPDSSSGQDTAHTQPICCFSYTSRRIPRIFVADYFVTSIQCTSPGVVFLTRRKRHICANPSDAWVQEYIEDLDQNVWGAQRNK
ncbi:C-C motif chemokine 3-like [Dasypus novemcinctus]|uniref:C-C motif chemokine 3-like n=1 Tax=Dasypus novemcinctus TaxID=9361 RepID=UPI000328A95B|nr:C-C motif chemokine 3-like [Dasypus novemcinctus]